METFKVISREELEAKIRDKAKFTLIEVLPKAAYEHAHLPHAINIPLDDLPTMMPRLVPSTWEDIVVYCGGPT